MPDDLGEYDEMFNPAQDDLGLPRLKRGVATVNEDPAGDDPYRGTLAGLYMQRKAKLRQLRQLFAELVELNDALEGRTHLVVSSYTGVGKMGRWLMERAWRRIFRSHDVSLRKLIGAGRHCADDWECCHRDGMLCDDACAEQHNLRKLRMTEKKQELELSNKRESDAEWLSQARLFQDKLNRLAAPPEAVPATMRFNKSRD